MTTPSNITLETAPHADGAARTLVAVTDPASSARHRTPLFRLGSIGPELTLGDTLNGQSFPWAYFCHGETTFEIDLLEGTLTVASTNPRDGHAQAVTYPIDVDAMKGSVLREGQPLEVVFLFQGVRSYDLTGPITGAVTTTGPRFGADLAERLGTGGTALRQHQDLVAAAGERTKVAVRPPRTARTAEEHEVELVERLAAPTPEVIDLREPEAVRVPDPSIGEFVGRRWVREDQETTLADLRNAGYRAAYLQFTNGEHGMVLLVHPSGKPMLDITAKDGNRIVQLGEWSNPIAPGKPLTNTILHSVAGQDEVLARPFPDGFVVDKLTAIGNRVDPTVPVDYPIDSTAVDFRRLIADRRQIGRRERHHRAMPSAPAMTPVAARTPQQPAPQRFDLMA